jgi:uncharacterized membrane protein YczE
MTTEHPQMKSIWYLVGLILMSMGVIIFIAGLVSSEPQHTVLAELRTNIWWGLVMVAGGLILFLTNRKSST